MTTLTLPERKIATLNLPARPGGAASAYDLGSMVILQGFNPLGSFQARVFLLYGLAGGLNLSGGQTLTLKER